MRDVYRFIGLIEKYIDHFGLDLRGSVVLTEAVAGYYACTPLIAAAAGAEVYAVARDSNYGRARDGIDSVVRFAELLKVESSLKFISHTMDAELSSVNIVTNSGLIRPISREVIEKLNPGSTVALMYEAWEFRPGDVDMISCLENNIAVFGTNEDHGTINVFNFVGPLLAKLLFELKIEIFNTNILVVGEDKFSKRIYNFLDSCGAFAMSASNNNWIEKLSPDLDAVVFSDYSFDREYIGKNGMIDARTFAGKCPFSAVCIICGKVDVEDVVSNNINCFPKANTYPYRMTKTFDYLGPLPLTILQTAGLKVGEISLKTWNISRPRQENIKNVCEASHYMADPVNY